MDQWLWSDTHIFSALHSVETVNDGSFHAVELVASDQTLSLSIDGGTPKSISSISKQSTLNVDSPLYLGGEASGPLQWQSVSVQLFAVISLALNHSYT